MRNKFLKLLFVIIDLVVYSGIMWLDKYVLFRNIYSSSSSAGFGFFIGFGLLLIYLFEGYELDHFNIKLKHVLKILLTIAFAGIAFSTLSYWLPTLHISRKVFLTSWGLFALMALFWRVLFGYLFHAGSQTPLVLLGCSSNERFLSYLEDDGRFYVAHKIDGDCAEIPPSITQDAAIVCDFSACDIPASRMEALEQELIKLRIAGHRIYDIQGFYQRAWDKVPVYNLSNYWFLFSPGFTLAIHPYYRKLKRLTDTGLAFLGLILALPLFLIVPLLIRMESRGAAFFTQERVGLHSKPFKLLKFRSMCVNAEENGARWASCADPRVTRVGCWLRKLRIDEAPQLINVLRGEMSFIGPRPERPVFVEKLEKKIPFYQMRHIVKPGITGWAQVNYPYGSSVEDAVKKLEYDLFYVKNFSFLLDIRIVLRTIRVVLFGKGQ